MMINQNHASNSNKALHSMECTEIRFDGMQFLTPGYSDDPNPYTAEIMGLLLDLVL